MYRSEKTKHKGFIAKLLVLSLILPMLLNSAADTQTIEPASAPTTTEGNSTAISCSFEDQTAEGFMSRGGEKLSITNDANHTTGGAYSLKVTNRTSAPEGAQINVLNNIVKGCEYKVTAWVKLISPESCTMELVGQLGSSSGNYSAFSLERKTVSSTDGWVKLEGIRRFTNYDCDLVIVTSTSATASYYIDDISVENTGAPCIDVIEGTTSIKAIYKNDFLIGNMMWPEDLTSITRQKFLAWHNDVMTFPNEMTPGILQPAKGQFNWTSADRLLAACQDMGLYVHGRVLCWHEQTPSWFNKKVDSAGNALYDTSGNPVYLSREEALNNLRTHIKTVMEHYGNQVISWDVVNQAVYDTSSDPTNWKGQMRKSPWYNAIGPDYVEQAFLAAREVLDAHPDWNIKLYYNDYNEDYPDKATAIYNMIKELNENYQTNHPGKLLIDGIGMESHYNMTTNSDNVKAALEKYASLGVEISISELDVLTGMNYSLSQGWAEKQAALYAQLFQIYKQYADHIARVTIWGTDDSTSWRASQNPLPFNRQLTPKPAYYAIKDPDDYLSRYAKYFPPATKGSTAVYGTPVIDGAVDDIWNNATEMQINSCLMAVQGANGTAKALWDDENLYVLFCVNDTQLDITNTDAAKQDSVEAFVDEDRIYAWPYLPDDGEYRVNYANAASFKFLSSTTTTTSAGFKSATTTDGTKYTVEMKIPLKTITPDNGTKIRFEAEINDASSGYLQSVATWNDIVGRASKSTEVFGDLTLTGKGLEKSAVKLTGKSSVLPGETFTVGIALSNLSKTVYAQDITLNYDSGLFDYINTTGSAVGTQIIRTDASVPGKVRIIGVSIGGVMGDTLPIMDLGFKVKAGVMTGSGIIAVTKASLGIMPEGTVEQATPTSKTITVASVTVDKSELVTAITTAQTICDRAVTGSAIGQYPEAAKTAFQAAINAASAVNANANATLAEVNAAIATLNTAKATFEASVIIAPAVNKSELVAAITAAQTICTNAAIGIENGQHWASDKAAFQTAIDAANAVNTKVNATQDEVDAAVVALSAAKVTFEASAIKATTGDLNNNTTIDVGDLAIVAYYYDANLATNTAAKVADINKDGVVDIMDLAFIATRITQ